MEVEYNKINGWGHEKSVEDVLFKKFKWLIERISTYVEKHWAGHKCKKNKEIIKK